jgi:hypothetical protein
MQGCGTDEDNITFSVLEEFVSVVSIEAVLMDKTTVITGFDGGLHACLDKKLRRKLHYTSQVAYYTSTNFLCIHAHIIRDLDGGTAR